MSGEKPHLSISNRKLAERVLDLTEEEFGTWPDSVQELAANLAAELFIIRYNPFIPPGEVHRSVFSRLEAEREGLSEGHYEAIYRSLQRFWQSFQAEREFRAEVIRRLKHIVPEEHIYTSPNSLVECATDATDLRLEVPMLIVAPGSSEEVRAIISLANEMGFHLVPRGGGSGLTGGAVPAKRRTVVVSLSRMKDILAINREEKFLCAQTGVITLNAIQAAEENNLLLTVDPASKASSSLGGNISENAGGPFAFEYGTTLDNLLSYKMVLPDGELIEVRRKNHPRHKILSSESPQFEIYDASGSLKETITLSGEEIRAGGLGKDVSNKYLGGLPGMQKEGVDGIVTEACFVLHDKLPSSITLCLEFFGNSMHQAMQVIRDLVDLRDRIRKGGDLVKMSALEEFGTKYVQAIEYEKKSDQYEGEPISVLLLQLDSGDRQALDETTREIVQIAESYHNVDVFVAASDKEAEIFWQDRHRLSAITRRTSGFKINEDIVIPIDVIPEFSDFIEGLNLHYLALAYRRTLQQVTQLQSIDPGDAFIEMELDFAQRILKGEVTTQDLAEQEFELQIHYFFHDLKGRYPYHEATLRSLEKGLFATRIMVANHMHAGDGNCHVNIPVNSNDPDMMQLAEEAAEKVFSRVLQIGGSISGEHGIGITKIGFLHEDKIQALRDYKARIDPKAIFNPGKLTQKTIDVTPYTFSFNRLIQDLDRTTVPQKEKLTEMLKNIQICSRCGKCKQVCPMYYPEQGYLYHPRNKIISLGALIEAYYYTRQVQRSPNKPLLRQLQDLIERCTTCGKCMDVCPVKIDMPSQILSLRSFLEEKRSGGHHPVKSTLLPSLVQSSGRLATAAKTAAVGQKLHNKVIGLVPHGLRQKAQHPLLSGPGPNLGFRNLHELLRNKGNQLLWPKNDAAAKERAVFYFPGCGAGLFYSDIGLAAISMLLRSGRPVLIPPAPMCCGYPLLASGCEQAFESNEARNRTVLKDLLQRSLQQGITVQAVLTSCGTCRESLGRYDLEYIYGKPLLQRDVVQYLLEDRAASGQRLAAHTERPPERILYHPSCHAEWQGAKGQSSGAAYADALKSLIGSEVLISPGCCGESGLGALTSPGIYSTLRQRKARQLDQDLTSLPMESPVLVGCPSCKVGLSRILADSRREREVLHSLELLARLSAGPSWQQEALGTIQSRDRV